MSKQLVIVLSGKKQSGKTTTCCQIAAKLLNAERPEGKFFHADGDARLIWSKGNRFDFVTPEFLADHGIKLYSFADPLKEFCINVLGAKYEQCYGSDAQKDSIIPHLLWDNVPLETRPFTVKAHPNSNVEFAGEVYPAFEEKVHKTGPMNGRELMQWFGTDICRRLYGDVWARGTYTKIRNEGYRLALVTDGRFPNEIDIGSEVNAKTVRLRRAVKKDDHPSELALDNYPLERFTAVLDNGPMSLLEQSDAIDHYLESWFEEAGIPYERRTSPQVPTQEAV